jgi:hypothetical protein
MIFMGEEWGATTPFQFFSSVPDAGRRKTIRRGHYAEFAEHGWDETDDQARSLAVHRGVLRVVSMSAQPTTVALDSQPRRVLLEAREAITARLDGESFAVVAVALSGKACAATPAR